MTPQYKDPRKQFSKWLARYGSVAWGVFLALVILLLYFQPETSMACVYLVLIVTVNKIVDTLAYTDNSKTEKFLLTALDRTKLEIGLKGIAQSVAASAEKANSEKKEEEESEEGGNG